jgi:hypothetical protein
MLWLNARSCIDLRPATLESLAASGRKKPAKCQSAADGANRGSETEGGAIWRVGGVARNGRAGLPAGPASPLGQVRAPEMPASSCDPGTILLESRPLPCPGRRPSKLRGPEGAAWCGALPPPRGECASFGGSRLRLSRPANRRQLRIQRALNGVRPHVARGLPLGGARIRQAESQWKRFSFTFAREMCESAHPTWWRDLLARSGPPKHAGYALARAVHSLPTLEAAGGSVGN